MITCNPQCLTLGLPPAINHQHLTPFPARLPLDSIPDVVKPKGNVCEHFTLCFVETPWRIRSIHTLARRLIPLATTACIPKFNLIGLPSRRELERRPINNHFLILQTLSMSLHTLTLLSKTIVTWLILPVVICLFQRLSHACLSISELIQ